MGHSIRVTPAQIAYERKYQPTGKEQVSPVVTVDHEELMRQIDTCRSLALRLNKQVGARNADRFWAAVPSACSTQQDIEYAKKFLALLEEQGGDFAKALAAFHENLKRGG